MKAFNYKFWWNLVDGVPKYVKLETNEPHARYSSPEIVSHEILNKNTTNSKNTHDLIPKTSAT